MKWLVCISTSGVECKMPIGENPSEIKNLIKSVTKQHFGIYYVFERHPGSIQFYEKEENSYSYNSDNQSFINWCEGKKHKIAFAHGADTISSKGYELRKRYIGNDYIEVLADLEAEDYKDFQYYDEDGAIEILSSAEKLMHPSVKDSSEAVKLISKWIKKLELEKEE